MSFPLERRLCTLRPVGLPAAVKHWWRSMSALAASRCDVLLPRQLLVRGAALTALHTVNAARVQVCMAVRRHDGHPQKPQPHRESTYTAHNAGADTGTARIAHALVPHMLDGRCNRVAVCATLVTAAQCSLRLHACAHASRASQSCTRPLNRCMAVRAACACAWPPTHPCSAWSNPSGCLPAQALKLR